MRKFGFLFLILGSLHTVQAQKAWTLEQCIKYALENNLEQHSIQLDEQTSRIDVAQAKLNLLPSVSASVTAEENYGRSTDPSTNDVINIRYFENYEQLYSSMMLFQGFMQLNKIGYRKFLLDAARWKTVNNQDQLAFDILTSYYDVVYYQGVIAISKEQLNLSEFNLRKTEIQIETGLKAKTDLAEMQATYEQEKLNLIQAENRLEKSRLELSRQLGLPAGEFIEIAENNGKPVAMDNLSLSADSLFFLFNQLSPSLKMAQAQLGAAQKNVAVSRGAYYPSLSIGASVYSGYYDTNVDADGHVISFRDQLKENKNQYIAASLSIPVFNRAETRNNVRKARLAKEKAQIELDNERQMLYYELANNVHELKALYRECVQTQKQVAANEQAYNVAQRKYDEGLIDVIEMLSVKGRLSQSKSDLLSAELKCRIKDKTIDFYKGTRFWETMDSAKN
jgi:outer membrane protein